MKKLLVLVFVLVSILTLSYAVSAVCSSTYDIAVETEMSKVERNYALGGDNNRFGSELDGQIGTGWNQGVGMNWAAGNGTSIVYYYPKSHLVTEVVINFKAESTGHRYEICLSNDGGATWTTIHDYYPAEANVGVIYEDRIAVNEGKGMEANAFKFIFRDSVTTYSIALAEIDITATSAGGCTWNEGTVTTDATCKEAGEKTFTCTVCGDTKTEAIPATGNHSYTEFVAYVEGKEPTCAVVGEATYKCATCDGTEVKPVDATGEHNYSEFVAYVEGKEPTCAVAGEATYKCATCDGTQVKDVEATGNHSYTEFVAYVEGKEPTCGAAGEATYKCATCDGTEVKPVDATGDHKYTEFVGVKYPNGFLAEGVKEYACVCEATTSEAAPAIFEFLGYSVKEDESAICAGYTVNREALELYEEMNETKVKFGVVAAGYDNLVNADGKPINADGTTAEVSKGAVIAVGFENDIYTSFAIRMVADDWTAVADAKIILGAYVIDGDVVSYICSDVATEAAAPITYNSINGGNN